PAYPWSDAPAGNHPPRYGRHESTEPMDLVVKDGGAERRVGSLGPAGQFETESLGRYLVSVVGTSRCDVPARVQRAERIPQHERTTADVAPLDGARTAQRAVLPR